jgi:hypothetical protein
MENHLLDISFFKFINSSHICQLLPQVQRVVAWICTVLLPDSDWKDQGKEIATKCQAGTNIHSVHLVALFGEEYQQHASLPHTITDATKFMVPSYLFVAADNSISQKELILQQCIQGSELNWEHTSLENFPLDDIFLFVEGYFQPLKLLSTLQPVPLFHLLESATRQSHPTAIEILESTLLSLSNSTFAKQLLSTKLPCS